MYLNLTEKIMIEKTQSLEGWNKSITDDNKNVRFICIGNIKNCNDEIIKNINIKTDIINILDKYNIELLKIENIITEYEFSYIVSIEEEEYKKFKLNI
jgi:hypothetical protein